MSWTTEQWSAFCVLLDDAWPGDFSESAYQSWRALLDGIPPDAAAEGLRRLLYGGQRFRPSVSELLAACRVDPGRPTFDEALRLIGSALHASCPSGAYDTPADMRRAHHAAIVGRASTLHPLVLPFMQRQGIDRLLSLELEDPEWGEKRRRDLQLAWEQFVESAETREAAVLASGGSQQLHQLDPLTALGLERPQLTQPREGER